MSLPFLAMLARSLMGVHGLGIPAHRERIGSHGWGGERLSILPGAYPESIRPEIRKAKCLILWLPFLDTYRTMCHAPEGAFRDILEDVRKVAWLPNVRANANTNAA